MRLKTIFLLSLFVSMTACGKKEEKAHEVQMRPTVHISVAGVEKGDLPRLSESVGTVRAAREAVVASKIMGSVVRLNFREGDRVKEGAVLVEIDDREINAQLEQAQAAVSETSAAYKNAEINLKRIKALLEQRSATQQQADNAVAQFDMAKARVQQAHANVEALKVMLGYTRIAAPFAGVITEKGTEKGEMTAPGRPVFKIVDESVLRLETEVRESEIKELRVGKAMDVRIEAIGRVLHGKVSQIIPSGDPAIHSFMVKIDLPGTGGLLPGMFGRASVPTGTTLSTLLVPESAVIEKGQMKGVFVVKDGTVGYRMIKTGVVSNDRVEVLSGLTEGEEVAVSNLEKLSDGSPVEIAK